VTPTVSVCIPTYNGAPYIDQTIRAVLAQTYDDFELIVRDDGSTDATLEMLAGITDSRVTVIADGNNVGAARNFNRAIAPATGRYLKLLCQDDVIYPHCLERQVRAMEEGAAAGVVLVGARRDIVDEDGRVLLHHRGWRHAAGVMDGAAAIRASVRAGTNLIGEPSVVLCDRALVHELHGFDTNLAYPIDLDLWIRMLGYGSVAYVPEALGTFRVSTTSWSATLTRRQAQQGRAMLRATRAARPDVVRSADLAAGLTSATTKAWGRRAFFLLNRVRRRRAGETAAVGGATVPSADVA
jgi:GT2 family glycosyltransferase